ncbi:T9SS type A sorting domain-containing protein [Aurantibacillus circumpalustris]|uniref:T9SS type A sorting domain-containing protein n=1 Tax=Aurantibacillus circumpalustris TaxID=3036359 RepID=UPI00295A7603|nr:T9SS type A sorting domain-containing protein [Aurantibacillus circumpalustris]
MKKNLFLILLAIMTTPAVFGQCTFGSYPAAYIINPGWTNGSWLAQQFTLSSTATLTGLGLNSGASNNAQYRMAIYTDNAGFPGTLVSSTSQGTVTFGTNILPVQSNTVLPAGNYWIMANYNGVGPATYSSSGAATNMCFQPGSLSNPPATNSTWSTGPNYRVDYWAVINSPMVTVSGSSLSCSGSSVTLTAGGALSYSWSTTANANTISVAPTSNSSYTVAGINLYGCINYAIHSITVNPLPTVAITGLNTVCVGVSASQTVSGASTYSWTTGATTNTVLLSPNATSVYAVTGTDGNGCSSSVTKTIAVNALPTLVINGNNSTCVGSAISETVVGASTYSWNTGATTNTVVTSPSTNTILSVVGTDANGCSSTVTKSITVNALPNLTVSLSDPILCAGQEGTITVTGVTSCSWNTGATGTNFLHSPTTSVTYTVTGMDGNGCVNSANVSQTVGDCTGIENEELNPLSILVMPNPGHDLFVVKTNSGNLTFHIYNSVGMLIETINTKTKETQIDLSNQANGIYYLVGVYESGTVSKKIMKF